MFVACLLCIPLLHLHLVNGRLTNCVDSDVYCYTWVAENNTKCDIAGELPNNYCRKSCQMCDTIPLPKEYDLKRVPPSLISMAFLIGKWRSEFGGKAVFPTIPKFTYGEELDFKLIIEGNRVLDVLNYMASAWDNSDLKELHSEYGFLSLVNDSGSDIISFSTVMSNGFITVERGQEQGLSIELTMQQIGRITFSHDPPVRKMSRSWTLLDPLHLEARLSMSTTGGEMKEHTSIVYDKIYP